MAKTKSELLTGEPATNIHYDKVINIISGFIVAQDDGNGIDQSIPMESLEQLAAQIAYYIKGVAADAMIKGFQVKDNRAKKAYTDDYFKKLQPSKNQLANRLVVFTGTLQSMTRSMAIDAVHQRGGTVGTHVTADTDYLVSTRSDSVKFEQAEEMGVRIISEADFINMVNYTSVLSLSPLPRPTRTR